MAAPVFKVVAGEALRVFDVPKDLPENVTPTLVAKNPEDLDDLAIADLAPPPADMLDETDEAEAAPATPPVYGPHPVQAASAVPRGRPAGAPPGAPAALPAEPKPRGPRVPNFRGMTMRAVLAEAAAKGLSVLPDGSGIARVQSPPPGAPLHQGERIRVQFAQMNLGEILSGVALLQPLAPELAQSPVAGIEYDSRRVAPQISLFRFPGSKADGRQFAADALARGALAVVSESAAPPDLAGRWIQVAHGRQALSLAARNFLDGPTNVSL